MSRMTYQVVHFECSQLILASAIIARGSSAGCAPCPLSRLFAANERSRKPDIGHPKKVAGYANHERNADSESIFTYKDFRLNRKGFECKA